MVFKTRLGRNIYKVALGNHEVERNPLFSQGRMAYVVELNDEMADSDIPTTLLRSIADVPTQESVTTLTTNDIVINKLAQILSYLRQGPRHKKSRKRDKVVSVCISIVLLKSHFFLVLIIIFVLTTYFSIIFIFLG